MPSINIKKPRFVGVSAGLLAEVATNGIAFDSKASRSAAARKAIADAYVGEQVTILRVRGERLVLTDPMPASLPAPIEVETEGVLVWSGPTGAIVVATTK